MAADILAALVAAHLAGCIGIMLVLALRVQVRRAFGAATAYRLWIVPILMAAITLIPVPEQAAGRLALPIAVDPAASLAPLRGVLVGAGPGLASTILLIWLSGALFSAAGLARRQWRFQRGLGALRPIAIETSAGRRRIFLAATTDGGPALVGIFAPRIVLPADFHSRFSRVEQALVIAHESVHLRSGDAVVNALVAVLQSLSWFNPLVHHGAARLRLDQELACDAAVQEQFPNARRCYAEAMIKTQVAPGSNLLACSWSPQSDGSLRERILSLELSPVTRRRRRAGMLAIAALNLIFGYAAWANAPRASGASNAIARSSEAADRNVSNMRGAVLRLTVASGISVRSSDGRFSCIDAARCEFDLPSGGSVVMRAAGRSGPDYRWTGCTSADRAGGCIVDMTHGRVSVDVR